MKKNFFYLFIAFFAIVATVSCTDDEPNVIVKINEPGENPTPTPDPDPTPADPEKVLTGKITEDKTVGAGETWVLDGIVVVEEGATLTIGKGATIIANPNDGVDALFINQGAMINAVGTASEPIVMTSTVRERGSFGGVVILGRAPINVEGGESTSELGTEYKYGGNDPADNSGVMKFVRVEYAGKKNSSDNEFNGFSLYAVGNGTTLENLQAYYGSDDGFEFFGGTVVANNLISTGNEDDAIDWTEGWTGGGENWLIELAEDDGDFGFEASGNDENPSLEPYSKPVIKNVTIRGNAISVTEEKSAIRLKSGTNIDLQNVLITGYPKGIRFDKDQSVTFLKNDEMVIKGVKFGSDVSTHFVNKSDIADADFQAAVAKIELDDNASGAQINRGSWALDL
ncbi:hypothetical protein C7377_0593 [Balneicella halophila]|uniref:Uncharacterized protein n=1 Tax=Balneicella halophila TaxID=1537566 RepID=A0A7L4UT84_BALHA|nr:hypothetical protein [Balneicella halophila]PVX52284.1 hypothetical protein C7377_0593 [Balneicella halophila]